MKTAVYYHKSYDGGLNDTASAREIRRDQASVLNNWCIKYQGRLFRRDGLTQVGDDLDEPASGLHAYLRSDGGKDLLVMDGDTLKYLNGSTFSDLDTGFADGKLFSMETCPVNDKVYISNEDNTTHSWDRASTTTDSCLTDLTDTHYQANIQRWHKNHMFYLNNLGFGGNVYPDSIGWSAMNDPDTHDTTNDRINIPGNGRVITAVDQGNVLVIFKERSIVYLSGWGDTDWRITATASNVSNFSEQVGCVAPRGACRVGNEVWFIDDEGQIRRIYQTDFDAFRSDHVSTNLQTLLGGINKAQLSKAVMWSSGDHVFATFPNGSDTENSITVAYDLIASKRNGHKEAWEVVTGWHPRLMTDYLPSSTPVMYIADAEEEKIYAHTGVDDDEVAIDARYDSKDDDYDKPDRYKRYRFGNLQGSSGSSSISVDFYASVDLSPFANLGQLELEANGSTLGPTGTFRLGPTGNNRLSGGGRANLRFLYTDGGGTARGRTVRHSIRHSTAGEQPTVDTFSSNFKERDPR